jgi:hypothetical protein
MEPAHELLVSTEAKAELARLRSAAERLQQLGFRLHAGRIRCLAADLEAAVRNPQKAVLW